MTATRIGLEVSVRRPGLHPVRVPAVRAVVDGDYDECAVCTGGVTDWRRRIGQLRKRADSVGRGYGFGPSAARTRPGRSGDQPVDAERQGRPMSDGYLQPPTTTRCRTTRAVRHGVHTYGVMTHAASSSRTAGSTAPATSRWCRRSSATPTTSSTRSCTCSFRASLRPSRGGRVPRLQPVRHRH